MSGTNIYFSDNWQSQTFTSSGTFNVPDGVNLVFIELWGGGGSGGSTGGGGADGASSAGAGKSYVGQVPVTPGGSIPVTIGAGAAAGVGGSAGSKGADSVFSYVKARGGDGAILIFGATPGTDGLDSFRSDGGSAAGNFGGGEAGYGNGGDAVTVGTASDGGIAAGGGSGGGLGGDGGDGICIIHWQID